MTGLTAGGFLSLTALQAKGCGGGFAAIFKVSVTGFAFYVIWHEKHPADWLAALASPYPAAPDFPLFRGQNKTPRNTLFINGSTVSTGCCATSKRGKGGGASHQRGNAFPSPAGRLYGFMQTGAFYNLEAPTTTLSGKAAVKLKNPRGDSPVKL